MIKAKNLTTYNILKYLTLALISLVLANAKIGDLKKICEVLELDFLEVIKTIC